MRQLDTRRVLNSWGIQMSRCKDCYYNSKLDFFSPGVDKNGNLVDECALDKQGYPHAKNCPGYEAADRDPEMTEDVQLQRGD